MNQSTTLESILRMGMQSNIIEAAVTITSMVEEIDRIVASVLYDIEARLGSGRPTCSRF
jgi:hypothetical protein